MFSLDVFENSREAVLAVDENGVVIMINRAAASLFGVDRRRVRGMRCWQTARLLTEDGAPLCRPLCQIQKELCGNDRPVARDLVIFHSSRGERIVLDCLTIPMIAKASKRSACLHLMAPTISMVSGLPDVSATKGAFADRPMTKDIVARMLTAREVEILELLSRGRRTRDAATLLSVSVATVRNHIEHIHSKLGVHRRIDAVLLWLASAETPRS